MPPTADQILDRYLALARPLLSRGRLAQMHDITQHGSTSTLEHCAAVAYVALAADMLLGLGLDEEALVEGGLLHDYFLYDWHDASQAPDRFHGFTHPRHALRNALADFSPSKTAQDVIERHMFPFHPLPPRTREGWVVCLADKACTTAEVLSRHPYARHYPHNHDGRCTRQEV